MAQKRMFDKTITNSDDFLELPDSSQVLYFHLNMNADDDGFVNNWRSIIRMTGTKEDDLKLLITKSFVIPFESGVIVIKHWRINNYLRNDRYKQTKHKEELSCLSIDENGEYLLGNQLGIPIGNLEKKREEENSKEDIINYYNNNIHNITQIELEKIENWEKEFTDDIIKEAINIAVMNNKRNMGYINGTLRNWKDKGIKTLQDIRNENKDDEPFDYEMIENFDKELNELYGINQ